MSRRGPEDKPAWSSVPKAVRLAVREALGAPVARAARVYGGFAPSATFRLTLEDGGRAFFKGVNASSNDFMRRALVQEERVYRELSDFIRPWAPEFLGAIRVEGWHAILLEDVGPADVPPWTAGKTRDAARSFAAFHRSTIGRSLPPWVTDEVLRSLAGAWERLVSDAGGIEKTASLAGPMADDAREWLLRSIGILREAEGALLQASAPHALLYLDARGDNVRWNRGNLRIFDWNWVAVGPIEADVAAFAEGITAEGGPRPAEFVKEYERALPVRDDVLISAAVNLAGIFARSAPRPAEPGLPRLPSIRRRQLKACLTWAAQGLGLPEPRWLAAVAD